MREYVNAATSLERWLKRRTDQRVRRGNQITKYEWSNTTSFFSFLLSKSSLGGQFITPSGVVKTPVWVFSQQTLVPTDASDEIKEKLYAYPISAKPYLVHAAVTSGTTVKKNSIAGVYPILFSVPVIPPPSLFAQPGPARGPAMLKRSG